MNALGSNTSILGISPEDDRLRLWMWSQAAGLQVLGVFSPGSVSAVADRLRRNPPDLQVFIAPGAAAVLAGVMDPAA